MIMADSEDGKETKINDLLKFKIIGQRMFINILLK
jgi:hypothetical protein